MNTNYLDPFVETLGRDALTQIQLKKLQMMLNSILKSNSFYKRKFYESGLKDPRDIRTIEDLQRLPFTKKEELSIDQINNPPFGTNLTYNREQYTHIHQTSGTTGEPLRWLDTAESWKWWSKCWASVYRAAGVTSLDRIFFAFSFGPFIGFWSAYEGANSIGALTIPGGGMSSFQRAKAISTYDVSVLVCTPTYALHLAEVAEQEGIDIKNSSVNITIQAGEPGASIPATKNRIETLWGSRCYDHPGATEIGAWGFECQAQDGVHINEGEFIYEVIDPVTCKPSDSTCQSGEEGELVLTNLGREGMPLIRYRTGDRVKIKRDLCECERSYIRLDGGVIGRTDDVLVVRGINVFPSAIENIVRRFSEISEFSLGVYRRKMLDEMELQIEVKNADPKKIAKALTKDIRNGIGLRAVVKDVPFGTLPRFDHKSKRLIDYRKVEKK